MSTITLRLVKGTPLTNSEVDNNFSNLNTDKYQAGASPDFVDTLTDKLSLDTAAGATVSTGEFAWNVDEGTADLGLNGGSTVLQLGQEVHYRVINKTGSTITNGTLCMYDGTVGASGQIKVKPWVGGSDPLLLMGIATGDILNDERGYVTSFGKVRKINTTGTPYSETWADGDILYAGPSGGLTKVKPTAPDTKSVIAAVVKADANVGELLVRVTLSSSIENDDEVEFVTAIADKDLLQWNGTAGRFENKSLTNAGIQATLVSGTNIKTVNSNSLVGSGDVSVGTVTSIATNNGVTGGTITSTGTIGLTGQALALHNLATSGVIARTGAGTVAGRTITAGTGISVSNGDGVAGNPTITNTAPDQTVAITAGTGMSVTGTYPNFTVTNNDRGSSQNIFKNFAVSGQSTIVADGNDDTLTVAAGTGITLTTNATTDTLTVTNSAPDQTVALTGAGGISISGTYPNFTITGTTYSLATSTVAGLVELGSDTVQSVAANAVTATASRSYAIQLNSAGQMVVNVPWVDTNTTYSAGNGIGLSGTTFSVAAGTGLTQDASGLSLTAITAGDAAVGAVRYNGTTNTTGQFYGGTTNPSATTRLNYAGNLHVTNLTAVTDVTSSSDERLKKDWSVLPSDFVYKLAQVKSGTYTRTDIGQRQAGVSAQSLQILLPEAVSTDENGMLSVAYGQAALTAAVELAKQVVQLQREVSELKARLGEK